MNKTYYKLLLSFFIFLPFVAQISAQEMVLVVERCKALNQKSPINNIWVDEENIKWVSNGDGLQKVLAIDLVQKVSIPAGNTSLLTIRGGNANIEWNTAEMQSLLGGVEISSASYDPSSKSLWIGTQKEGAFQVTLSPLRILQQFNTKNKKLTSNQINDIFIQKDGKVWIATDDGMLSGNGSKWSLEERYLNFVGVDAWGNNLWILGDDFLWQVDSRGKWNPIAIELKKVEGKLRDIAVDARGRVWIASNMMTGYDAEMSKYQEFGPGQYFTSQYVNCLDVDQDGSIWTGTDDKGLYLIQWESAMTVNIVMDTPLDCKNLGPTAVLSAKVIGGEAPRVYQWSTGASGEKISGLAAGTYGLTVTDAKGIIKSAEYEIPDPTMSIAIEIVKPSSGSADGDASVNLLVNGGSGQMTYQWDNGESTQLAEKLTSGAHSVTVTDETGCSATTSFNVTEKVLPLSVTLEVLSNNKCANGAIGELQALVSGGKPPIKYQWNENGATGDKISNRTAGEYSVTVADAAGQTASAYATITAPEGLEAYFENISAAKLGVDNGRAQVKVAGGTSPYTYVWDNGATTELVKNLSSGTHSMTITDANGCSDVQTIDILEDIDMLGVLVKEVGKINCAGQTTGSLRLDISGGKQPYTFAWNNGQVGVIAENLSAGPYTVTVTDAVGSTFTASFEVSEPAPVVAIATAEAPSSTNGLDGKASVKANGGTGTFQYVWDNGETDSKAIKLPAGLHTVTVTDAAGCSTTASVDISENILALAVSLEQTVAVKCAGSSEGVIEAVIKGGKEPFAYSWSNGSDSPTLANIGDGLYTITVTDVTGHTATSVISIDSPKPLEAVTKVEKSASTNQNDGRANITVTGGTGKYAFAWDNGELTAKASTLGAGTHTVTVTDENGCSATGSVMITENILPLSVTVEQTDEIKCAGQATATLTANVIGGKPPYSIQWKGPGKEFTGESVSQLAAGQYAMQVMDVNGTSATAAYEIKEPSPLVLLAEDIAPANTGDNDGSVSLKATGGTGKYTLSGGIWPSGSASVRMESLKPGEYVYTITDEAGCSAQTKVTITEDILPLSVSLKQTQQILCAGAGSASIEAIVKGGKAPFTYAWSNSSSGASLANLSEGKYKVTVSDVTGQTAESEIAIDAPKKLNAEAVNMRSATNDRLKDGKGQVEISGGTGPYTYLWSSGETTAQAGKLPLGPGTVMITDANGCTTSAQFVINEKVLPELTAERLSSGEPIRMEKIQFDADSIVIREDAIPSIDELFEFLYDNPTIIIEVSGHTNGLPADDYCDRISTARAKSVKDYLVGKGIEERRVISIGYGKRKPIATNQTPEGRKRNQRVEIRLIKIEE